MADPVRDALRVAAEVAFRSGGGHPVTPREIDDLACGIAAFLRSYAPARAVQGDLGPDLFELAAAVEAAGEARDA